MNRLEEIRKKEWPSLMPAFSKTHVSKDDACWLVSKIERYRKALEEIDAIANDTYVNSEAPELNDCIDEMQRITQQTQKEGEDE